MSLFVFRCEAIYARSTLCAATAPRIWLPVACAPSGRVCHPTRQVRSHSTPMAHKEPHVNPRHSGVQKPRFQSCFGLHTAVPSRFPVQTKVDTSQNHLHWLPCRDRALGRDTALLILASYISRYASPEVWWLFHRITDQCLQFASVYAKPQCKCCL